MGAHDRILRCPPEGLKRPEPPSDTGRGLLLRLPNYVGDAVMAWPAIARLVQAGWQPRLIGKSWAADLFAAVGLAVDVYPDSIRARITSLRRSAHVAGSRAMVLFTHSFSSAAEARLAGLRPTGYRKDARGWLLADSAGRLPPGHQVERYWQLVDRLCPASPPPADFRLPIDASARMRADASLAEHGIAEGFVLLVPRAGGDHRGRSKDWPHFPALAQWLHEAGWPTVISPGPGQATHQDGGLPDTRVLEDLDLLAVAALAERAGLVIANDAGLGHVAAAAGARLLSVFGHSDPDQVRPWSTRATVLGGRGQWPTLEALVAAARERLAAATGQVRN